MPSIRKTSLVQAIDARLDIVEKLLRSYVNAEPLPKMARHGLTQYAMVGSGRLRRMIAHSSFERATPTRATQAQMTAVVSLVGRSVDFAAAMLHAYPEALSG